VTFSIMAIAAALLLISGTASAGEAAVHLCREEVSITLEANAVIFESLYCFENQSSSPCSQAFFYEFPLDSLHLFPDTVSVVYGFLDLDFQQATNGISFAIQMPGECCASVRISYRQGCLEPTFCYTPKTIKSWNKPIEEADFEVRVPSGIHLESISYEMHEVSEIEGFKIHRFTCTNCLPSEDLCLRWQAY
jgi:hypothetical protein